MNPVCVLSTCRRGSWEDRLVLRDELSAPAWVISHG